MTNAYYNPTGNPANSAPGSSAAIRAEFSAIAQGFNKFPALVGSAGKFLKVNDSEDGYVADDAIDLNNLSVTGNTSLGDDASDITSVSGLLTALSIRLNGAAGGAGINLDVLGTARFRGGEASASGYGIRILNSTANGGGYITAVAGPDAGIQIGSDAGTLDFISARNVFHSRVGIKTYFPLADLDVVGGFLVRGSSVSDSGVSGLRMGTDGNNSAISWTSAPAVTDQKVWDAFSDNVGHLIFRTVNDANNDARTWMQINRIGLNPTAVIFGAPVTAPSFNGLLATNNVSQFNNDAGYLTSVASVNANALSGVTLASNVVNSSLTSVGVLGSLMVATTAVAGGFSANGNGGSAFVAAYRPSKATTQATLNIGTPGGVIWQTYLQASSDDYRIYCSALGIDLVTLSSVNAQAYFAANVNAPNFVGALSGSAPAGLLSGASLAAGVTTSSLQVLGNLNGNNTIAGQLIGYRTLPGASVSNGAIATTDGGCCVYMNGNCTLPAAAMPDYTVVVFQNVNNTTYTIGASSGTLRLTGTSTTGTRTINPYGRAAVVFFGGVGYISGDLV